MCENAGRGAAYLIMPGNYSALQPLPVSPLHWWDTSKHLQIFSCVPSVWETSIPNGHLLISCASLAISKNTAALLTERANYALLVSSTPAISCLAESCQCPKLLYKRLKHDLVDGRVVLITQLLSEKALLQSERVTPVKTMPKNTQPNSSFTAVSCFMFKDHDCVLLHFCFVAVRKKCVRVCTNENEGIWDWEMNACEKGWKWMQLSD